MSGVGNTEPVTYTSFEVRTALKAVLVASQPLVMRPLALACENEGWDTKVVPFEALTPALLSGAALVIVNPDDGLGLVQRVNAAVGDRHRMAALVGWWDLRVNDLETYCAHMVHYPVRTGEVADILRALEPARAARLSA